MAGNSTISITFKMNGDASGFKALTQGAEGLKAALQNTVSQAEQLKGSVINFAALSTGINMAQQSIATLYGSLKDLGDAYAVQSSAETRLATIMRQRMEATEEEIQSVKDLASSQQQLGIIGDEVQLSGIQQLATFLNLKSSIDILTPAMNNLLAQQKEYNATAQDAVNIGNLIGKAMQGQTAALRRVGITFDEAEERVLKFGNESERAAMLAQVITNNVGHMNEALAQQEPGKAQQVANALGDIKEQIGGVVKGALPFVTIAAQSSNAIAAVVTLANGIKALTIAVKTNVKAFVLSTAAFVKHKTVTLATAAAQKIAAGATAVWTGAQRLLNMVLTANPIGIVITAIGAMVTALIYAYRNSETFRNILQSLWEVIKPVADAIMNGLAYALSWVVEKARQAWEWLANLLGLGGKKAEVTVDVKTKGKPEEIAALEKKYEHGAVNAGKKTPSAIITGGQTKARYNEDATLLKDIEANITVLREKLKNTDKEHAAAINQQIAKWEEEAEAIKRAGMAIEDNSEKTDDNTTSAAQNVRQWNTAANTLEGIENNISILQDRLRTATITEAAGINKEIDLWNKKADAIRKAGLETVKQGEKMSSVLSRGWRGTKSITGGIENITNAVKSSAPAWKKATGLVDGFVEMYRGIAEVGKVVQFLTGLSNAHAAAKGKESVAEGAASAAKTTAATADVSASTAVIIANKKEAASFKELAASRYMAAYASIPFAGYAIGAGFVASMLALVKAAGVPAFAKGGIISGPTLALVGEYAGAGHNPEVIAPLDKLRTIIGGGNGGGGNVRFEIEGRKLVGILTKEGKLRNRS